MWIEVLFISKHLRYSFCTCIRNMLKIVMFVIGKMKLATFSLFLDAFPHRPKMRFRKWNVAINKRGGGGEGVV